MVVGALAEADDEMLLLEALLAGVWLWFSDEPGVVTALISFFWLLIALLDGDGMPRLLSATSFAKVPAEPVPVGAAPDELFMVFFSDCIMWVYGGRGVNRFPSLPCPVNDVEAAEVVFEEIILDI